MRNIISHSLRSFVGLIDKPWVYNNKMQFGGAFWETLHRFQVRNHELDNLLSNPETTIEEILDESSIIQEMRGQNQKLLE